jgi:hypothetical protein
MMLLTMTRYQLFICVTALALVLGGTLPGSAQSLPLRLATWDVQIWPEYDDPSVLVIAAGSLAAETPAPQQLRIPIPAGARVHAVAFPGPEGNLLTLPWSAETDASGQTLVFALDQPRFVVEYYADILAPPPSRSFDLDLVAPYAVQQASLALRQPSRASNLQVTPAMAEGGLDGLGNPTYALELGALEAGQAVPVRVSYTKADAEPSVAGLEVDETPAAAADGSAQSSLPVIIGVAAGLLAGAAALYLWTRRRSAGASRQARRRTARKQGTALLRPPTGSAAPGGAALNRFCVQCGQKFEGSDRFCRNCGAARR